MFLDPSIIATSKWLDHSSHRRAGEQIGGLPSVLACPVGSRFFFSPRAGQDSRRASSPPAAATLLTGNVLAVSFVPLFFWGGGGVPPSRKTSTKATCDSGANNIRGLTHSLSQNNSFSTSTGAIDHRNNTSAPSGHQFYAGGLGLVSAATATYTPRALDGPPAGFSQMSHFSPTAVFTGAFDPFAKAASSKRL